MARILILSFVEWAGAFQRPQHLALGLARRGHEVTYLEPGYLHRPAGAAAGAAQPPPSLRVVRAGLLPGASRALLIERLNLALLARRARALSSLPWDAVIFNDPRFATAAAAIPARRRVFDCMDDLSGQAASPTALATAEAAALTIADRVWTGTGMLESRLAGRHPSVRFIPCGVDYDLFSRPPGLIPAERLGAELPPGEGPLAGFFGVLNERFDARLLSPLLEAGWRVLLIGPATSRRPALPEHPALRAIGPRPYGELPDYLVRFDLGHIPNDPHGPHPILKPHKPLE